MKNEGTSARSLKLTRREFMVRSALVAGACALPAATSRADQPTRTALPRGRAEHCIFIWLGGGMAHMDTFDPKPERGDPQAKKPGSYYACIDTVVPGVQVCEHLPR